jgi:hypothetical protein
MAEIASPRQLTVRCLGCGVLMIACGVVPDHLGFYCDACLFAMFEPAEAETVPVPAS